MRKILLIIIAFLFCASPVLAGDRFIINFDKDEGDELDYYFDDGGAGVTVWQKEPDGTVWCCPGSDSGVTIDPGGGVTTYAKNNVVFVSEDGSIEVNGNVVQASGDYLATDEVRAIDGDGLKLYDDGGNGIFIEDGGQVGIGTTTSNESLTIFGNTAGGEFLEFYNERNITSIGDLIGGINFYNTDVSGGGPGVRASIETVAQDAAGVRFDMIFNFDADEKFRFTDLGFLGLGTSTPDAFLHIERAAGSGPFAKIINLDTFPNNEGKVLYLQGGSDSIESYILAAYTRGGTTVFNVRGSGHVGIGAMIPNANTLLDVAGIVSATGGVSTYGGGRIQNVDRITSGVTLTANHHNVFGDTDGGTFPVGLPAGVRGTVYEIANTGSSGNGLTIQPTDAELLDGAPGSTVLFDRDAVVLKYDDTEGWRVM